MYIDWNEELAVGVDAIDTQHKALFDRINELFKAIRVGKEKVEVLDTLKFLELYTIFHFKDEEEYMKKIEFSGYEEQRIEHEKFKRELTKLGETLEKEGISEKLVLLTQEKITSWLLNHILVLDKQIGKALEVIDKAYEDGKGDNSVEIKRENS